MGARTHITDIRRRYGVTMARLAAHLGISERHAWGLASGAREASPGLERAIEHAALYWRPGVRDAAREDLDAAALADIISAHAVILSRTTDAKETAAIAKEIALAVDLLVDLSKQ